MDQLTPIENMPTRQLLEYLRRARKFGGWYSPHGANARFGYGIRQLKTELATREHVPNKLEARAKRQAVARTS